MNEATFWQLIEDAWADAPQWNEYRAYAIRTNDPEAMMHLDRALDEDVRIHYENRLKQLSKRELTEFIHILEERIYNLDRSELCDRVEGSDDSFLYIRCFIVGVGEAYYQAIEQHYDLANGEAWAEGFGFAAYAVYEDVYGEEFDRYQFHSMETCSNEAGWV